MADTLLVDTVSWDLLLDISGDIAVAASPYSLAQDAASSIKLFRGELYFDVSVGVPYSSILGKAPPLALIKAQMVAAALRVDGVVSAQCFITSLTDRTIHGQVQVTDSSGVTTAADF